MARRNFMFWPFFQVLSKGKGVVMIRISRRNQKRDGFPAGMRLYPFERPGLRASSW
jgi:hypothetical protein